MSEPREPGHPLGSEVDDSQNPTTASPEAEVDEETHSPPGGRPADEESRRREQPDMLVQLQEMIDSLAAQAGPVMRDVAAKAAELAAIAAERAGPIAHRAADATERVGGRVAVRSKEMAAELRRQQQQRATEGPEGRVAESAVEDKQEADA